MARAVRFDGYGSRDVLYVADVEVGHPSAGEVLVAVRAAGLNPGEASIREGYLDAMWPATFPSGEGTDFAGVVSETGEGVEAWAVGDEVLGWSDQRASHAEFVTVPAAQLIAKPAGLSWEVAGSLFVAGTTAVAAVRAVGVTSGDTVVVSAAAGGVGGLAAQLARLSGGIVIGIASEANHDWLSSVGVTPVAYGDGLAQRIRAAAPSGVDAFIDTFGEEYVRLAVELGVKADRINTIIAFDAAKAVGAKAEGSAYAATVAVLHELADLLALQTITLPINNTYPLESVRDAYAQLEQRRTRGKIVLIPGSPDPLIP